MGIRTTVLALGTALALIALAPTIAAAQDTAANVCRPMVGDPKFTFNSRSPLALPKQSPAPRICFRNDIAGYSSASIDLARYWLSIQMGHDPAKGSTATCEHCRH